LGFIILIQNAKGGGLSGTIAGFNNQFMGVKQTTDVLEKGTWIFAAIIGVLCILSASFLKQAPSTNNNNLLKDINAPVAPQQQQSLPGNTVPFDSGK